MGLKLFALIMLITATVGCSGFKATSSTSTVSSSNAEPAPAPTPMPTPPPSPTPAPMPTAAACDNYGADWSGGNTLTVAAGESIQATMDHAADGDTVEIPSGTYYVPNGLRISKRLRLRSAQKHGAVLLGAQRAPLF